MEPVLKPKKTLSIWTLTWPLFFETLLRMLFTNVDIYMLSFYSGKAVAAVGLVGQLSFFIMILYMIVSNGSAILISQNLGAGRPKEADRIALASIVLNVGFAIILSIIMFFMTDRILSLFALEDIVHGYARDYFQVFASLSVTQAVSLILASILRSHGHSRSPMLINFGANILNAFGNCIAIFGLFGLPVTGVFGVALSTMISRFFACVAMVIVIKRTPGIRIPLREIKNLSPGHYIKVIKVGAPTAGENLAYNIAQLLIMRFISSMGTASLTAYTYSISLLRFVFTAALAVGQGTQILTGHLVGAGAFEEVYKKVLRYFRFSFFVSLSLASILYIFRVPLLGIFSPTQEVAFIAYSVLFVGIFLEPGRTFNLVIINGLKGAGDIMFPVIMGIFSMWGIAVGGSYLLGIVFGMGLPGVWIAMASDEWFRGIIMLFRWRSGVWRKKRLLDEHSDEE